LSLEPWKVFAGLGFFQFGISLLESGLRQSAGRSFKLALRKGTTHLPLAIFLGLFTTAFLQSSSLVMLMVIAFVGARVIGLRHALGIMLGANVGTTVTGWLVVALGFSFNVELIAYPAIAVGLIGLSIGHKNSRLKSPFQMVSGLGLIILGLAYMKTGTMVLATEFPAHTLNGQTPVTYALVGFALTAVVQSSSAVVAMTIAALHAGFLDLTNAAFLVIGADVGTTMTALLATLDGDLAKRRVAMAHLFFNLLTGIGAFFGAPFIIEQLTSYTGWTDSKSILVLFHSVFNFLGLLIFIPFLGAFARFLERWIKDNGNDLGFDAKIAEQPSVAVVRLDQAIRQLLALVIKTNSEGLGLNLASDHFSKDYEKLKVFENEILDFSAQITSNTGDKDLHQEIHQIRDQVRQLLQSAKHVKDIRHNLLELKNSSDPTSFAFYEALLSDESDFYQKLIEILKTGQPPSPDEVEELLAKTKALHHERQDAIQAAAIHLHGGRASSILNLNHELYLSKKALLLALGPENV